MKNQALSKILRLVSFLLIAVLLFAVVSSALERKTYTGGGNYMAKFNEFYDLPKNSLDYLCVGSSHAYCSVNPLEIWDETGLNGFVLATPRQPLQVSYHYIKEVFKTQSPKTVILEALMVMQDEHMESTIYEAVDPLQPSLNKIKMINSLVEPKKRDAYYFNILKYHTLWKSFSFNKLSSNINPKNDIYKGYVVINTSQKVNNSIPNYDNIKTEPLSEINIQYLNKIMKLVEENGAELKIMIAPYHVPTNGGTMKSARIWAEENEIGIIDYALKLEEIHIEQDTDYVDSGHLNFKGAEKVSRHLGNFLLKDGLIPTKTELDNIYEKDYKEFVKNYPKN